MRLIIPWLNRVHYTNYLLLLVICLLAYWPLTFGIFSVKNDAIHYFLPYRFNISEALQNGEWPFWSPYIYLGYPLHGDLQSGAWNPIVWLFSFAGRYDLTLFHYENLLYIFLAGVGMYKLTNRLVQHSHTALLIAVSYMLSGFMLSGQLINWLAAAAFLPFVIHYYLQTLRSPSFNNAIKTGIALFFLFTAGYPSFFITTSYILFILLLITVINRFRNKLPIPVSWKRFLIQQLLVVLVFTGLALPAIVSFIDLLPYYQRGNGTSYIDSIQNSFEWQHLLSMVFPSSIKANDIVSATDLTCRNVYPGIFTLLILAAFPPKLNKRNVLLISLAVFALLFSLGDATPVRKLCYTIVPLMDTFRHPSQMRLFFLFAVVLLAAPGLKQLLSNNFTGTSLLKLKRFTRVTAGLLFLITLIAIFRSGIIRQFSGFGYSGIRAALKNVIDSISLSDAIAVNGLLQLIFIAAFAWWVKRSCRPKALFSFLWVANLFIMAQLVLPITFVSKTAPREINALVHASPKGFPVNGLERSIGENSKDATDYFDKIALSYFYNKKIGISHISNSPSFLEEQEQFLGNEFIYRYVASLPAAYIADTVVKAEDTALLNQTGNCNYAFTDARLDIKGFCSPGDTAIIKKIAANRFEIETATTSAAFLVLTQNYHHHWKVSIDGSPGNIYKTNTSFMGTPIGPGKHKIIFRFVPGNTIKAMWILLATLVLLIITWAISFTRQYKLNTTH